MTLPDSDIAYLTDRGLEHVVTTEAGMTCIVFPGWTLPAGYDHEAADLLLRLQAGYPDIPPDMWWFDPALMQAGGGVIPGTEATEHHLGRTWQRWSRHFEAGQWQSGVDGLESLIALIQHELRRYATRAA